MSTMRLICPSCDAQYDVPAGVIPQGGRDVQCSDCAHTWFQPHPDDAEHEARRQQKVLKRDSGQQEDDEQKAPLEGTAKSNRLDPQIAAIFAEEREWERQRRASAGTLESQPELGLDTPSQARPARPASEQRPAPEPSEAQKPLPDAGEIHRSLRAEKDPRFAPAPGRLVADQPRRRRGFARGFISMVLLSALALWAYIYAAQISQAMPASARFMQAYSSTITSTRLWLNNQITPMREDTSGN